MFLYWSGFWLLPFIITTNFNLFLLFEEIIKMDNGRWYKFLLVFFILLAVINVIIGEFVWWAQGFYFFLYSGVTTLQRNSLIFWGECHLVFLPKFYPFYFSWECIFMFSFHEDISLVSVRKIAIAVIRFPNDFFLSFWASGGDIDSWFGFFFETGYI